MTTCFLDDDGDERDDRDEITRCPECGRVMSRREHVEQDACNDCFGGYESWA